MAFLSAIPMRPPGTHHRSRTHLPLVAFRRFPCPSGEQIPRQGATSFARKVTVRDSHPWDGSCLRPLVPASTWDQRSAVRPWCLVCIEDHSMTALLFMQEVAAALQCDCQRAESVIFAVFRELSQRLTAHEAADVASQLPMGLKRLWNVEERPDRPVEKMHRAEFIGRVRQRAVLPTTEKPSAPCARCSVRCSGSWGARAESRARHGTSSASFPRT